MSMKVNYKPRPNLVIEFEAQGQKDIFEKMAGLQEIFKQDTCQKCKKGQGDDLVFTVRKNNEGHTFYELRCTKCGATLGFGSHQQGGTIFPQRKDKDGNKLGDFGWTKWNPESEQRE